MAFPANTMSLPRAVEQLQDLLSLAKKQAESALGAMQSDVEYTSLVFSFCDRMNSTIAQCNVLKATPDIDAYARTIIPGYTGSVQNDVVAVTRKGRDCVNWITENFPRDSTDTYILAEILNADGTRTSRMFTPGELAPLHELLQAFIATIE